MQNPSPRICRLALALQEFTFDVKHRPGSKHKNPDVLSRLCNSELQTSLLDKQEKSFEQLQTEEPYFSDYRNFILQGTLSAADDSTRRILQTCHRYELVV